MPGTSAALVGGYPASSAARASSLVVSISGVGDPAQDTAAVQKLASSAFAVVPAILAAGGLSFSKALPEAEQVNFISRVRIPALVINGRYDHFFPVESSQKPFLNLLGTPEADKKFVIYETGHAPPRKEIIRESLDWLDKYLGPVKR